MKTEYHNDPAYIAHLENMAAEQDAYLRLMADHQEHELERIRAWG